MTEQSLERPEEGGRAPNQESSRLLSADTSSVNPPRAAGVSAALIKVRPQRLDRGLGVGQAQEPMCDPARVPRPAVERSRKRVDRRLGIEPPSCTAERAGWRPAVTQPERDGRNTEGRDGETRLDRLEKHRHDRRDGEPGRNLRAAACWSSGQSRPGTRSNQVKRMAGRKAIALIGNDRQR
jgi:hypothetical protein